MYAMHVLQGEEDVFVANVFVMKDLRTTRVAVQHQTEVASVVTGRYMSRLVGKPTMWFPTRSDTNRPVHLQKQARNLKFWS